MDATEARASESKASAADEATEPQSRLYERYRAIQDDPTREARWEKWREENAAAIAASNAWVEKHGLPLAKYRMF